jgi:acyl-coenzyme A synthetase/AMP-(fatty) acid ligase
LRCLDVEPAIASVTGPEGPFPILESVIDGESRKVFGGLPDSLSHALVERYGVQKCDRVAFAMRNSPEWCMSFMAITSIGAVAVPMNSWWQGEPLPRIASGKIFKKQIRNELIERLGL